MQQDQVINSLRHEAQRNPVVADVFHVFATRQRARHQVTVRALSMRMEKEGFKYKNNDYVGVLKLLSDTGFGVLRRDVKGQVTALTNIKVTLQSLGRAVIGKDKELKALTFRNKFSSLSPMAKIITNEAKPKPAVYPYRAVSSVSITLTINKKPVIIPLPNTLTPEEIAALIKHFQNNLEDKKPEES